MVAILLFWGISSLCAQTAGSADRSLPILRIDNLKGTINTDEAVEATVTITSTDKATVRPASRGIVVV